MIAKAGQMANERLENDRKHEAEERYKEVLKAEDKREAQQEKE